MAASTLRITEAHLADLEAAAKQLKDRCEIVVVIGIGGSYLGAKAVIEALSDSFEFLRSEHKNPLVLFAGHNIGEDYLFELQTLLKNKSFGIVVISKSGTTTEPAIAFRLLKEQLEAQVGKDEAKHRIIAITDAKKGALRKLADTEGYKTFVIADNVGGRFSVLTPVGLLPIAIAGFDIRTLVSGAVAMEKACGEDIPFEKTPQLFMLPPEMLYIKAGRKLKSSSTSILNYTSSQNGGNNSTEKAKEKKTSESIRHQSTSQPIYIRWDNGFRKVKEPSSKPFFRLPK